MTEPTDIDKDPAVTSRRRFLREGSALMGGAVIAGGFTESEALGASERPDNLPPNVPEWMKTPGDPMGSQLYGTPSPFEKGVIKNIPVAARREAIHAVPGTDVSWPDRSAR